MSAIRAFRNYYRINRRWPMRRLPATVDAAKAVWHWWLGHVPRSVKKP